MRLPERFSITIEGKLWHVRQRDNITPGSLAYMLAYLLSGRDTDLRAFGDYRLRVTVEPCTDQGDDEADALVVRDYGSAQLVDAALETPSESIIALLATDVASTRPAFGLVSEQAVPPVQRAARNQK